MNFFKSFLISFAKWMERDAKRRKLAGEIYRDNHPYMSEQEAFNEADFWLGYINK